MWVYFLLPRYGMPLLTSKDVCFVELIDQGKGMRLFHLVNVNVSTPEAYKDAYPHMLFRRQLVGPRKVADYEHRQNTVSVLFEDGELVQGLENE